MPIEILPERPDSSDARALIAELDAYLIPLAPAESRHGYPVEKLIAQGVAFFVVRLDGEPAGCGGVQLFGSEYAELKRMYIRPQYRGLGYAKQLIAFLCDYVRAQGIRVVRLETGVAQTEAARLYERVGFYPIPPFGSYRNDPLSLYYEKRID
jgi:putative acetyltransferase